MRPSPFFVAKMKKYLSGLSMVAEEIVCQFFRTEV